MRNYLIILILTFTANLVKAQPKFTNCLSVSQKANSLVEFVQNASNLIKNNQGNDTLIPTVKAKAQLVLNELRALENGNYNYSTEPNFLNYQLTRCYTAYFTFLLRINEPSLVEEIVEKNFKYFTYFNTSEIHCEVVDNVKKMITKSGKNEDGEYYKYTTEAYVPTVVSQFNIKQKEVLQNKAGLFTSIIMASSKLKNYAFVEKYFEAAYQANVWVNAEGTLPVSASKYALANYNDQAATVPTTTLHAAISYTMALIFHNALQTKIAPTASDTFYHQRSVDILLKVAQTKLDPTKISDEDFNKLMVSILRDKSISTEVKIQILQLNFESFVTSYNQLMKTAYNPLECIVFYNIFDHLPNYLKNIWATNDKKLIELVINLVNQKKISLLDNDKQLLYDVYLYCRDNGYKSLGKEIYNATLGKYAKDQYPK